MEKRTCLGSGPLRENRPLNLVTIDLDSFFTTTGLRGVAGALDPPTDEDEDFKLSVVSSPIGPLVGVVGLKGGVEGFRDTI